MAARRWHKRFLTGELRHGGYQAVMLVLCVALSVMTLVAVGGFRESLQNAFLKDARTLYGGDVIVRSPYPFPDSLDSRLRQMESGGRAHVIRVHEFYSVVRPAAGEDTVLAQIKIVPPAYPLYGSVTLASGKPFDAILKPGRVVVERNLLTRLGIGVGDRLHVGRALLEIADVVVHEPDRPVDFFSFGPRVFVSEPDLPALDLMKPGSRVRYLAMIRLTNPDARPETVARELNRDSGEEMEGIRIDTFRTARSRLSRFFENFLFFMALIGIFTLLLAGIGVQSTLSALMQKKRATAAMVKAIGAGNAFITRHYLMIIALYGLAGSLLGGGIGICLQFGLGWLLRDIMPPDFEMIVSVSAVLEGLTLGILVILLFGFQPLYRFQSVRPNDLFRHRENAHRRGAAFYLSFGAILLFFAGTVFWHIEDIKTGIRFLGGMAGLILAAWILTRLAFWLLTRVRWRMLRMRLAARGLTRPGAAVTAVVVSLSAALALIHALWLVEKNLNAAFVQSFPENAPNLFFLDIQPDQRAAVAGILGPDTRFYPVIRSRLIAVNGARIDPEAERRRKGDNLARAFNLTYRDHLLDDERFIAGKSLFRPDIEGLQVSVLDTVVEMRPMAIGDRLAFKIQGVPISATISSIRTREGARFSPFFYFVFPEDSVLRRAPHTLFAAVRVPAGRVAAMQQAVVAALPNVSAIDVTEVIRRFAEIFGRLSWVIRFLTAFSICAGILIIVSATLATRFQRTREAVYFKIAGADNRFILSAFGLENLIIAVLSAVLGCGLAQIAAAYVSTRVYEIAYRTYPAESAVMVLATLLCVTASGLVATWPVLREKPVAFLRTVSEE